MQEYNELQKAHYSRQYSGFEKIKPPEEEDLFGWCKWYPLVFLDDFFSTLSQQTLLVTCCGAGRELYLFHKHNIIVAATDLTIEHLEPLYRDGMINKAEIQDAQKLTFGDESFDYGFINAGLHHLQYPHAGLTELLRCSRKGVIFIESQDSPLHAITRRLGRRADFEPAGNYVYHRKRREVEKICLSAHLHSFAIKTFFYPLFIR